MFTTRTRLLAIAGGAISSLVLITAAVGASGPPTSLKVLLCGTTSGFSAYPQSGNSSVDHPTGLSASGGEYRFTGQNCTHPGSSTGNFTWAIRQDNVNTVTERGNEHADASATTLAQTGNLANGFDGQVFDFDLPSGDGVACGDGDRTVFYASGHGFDAACPVGSAPGNFNTEGGASTGQHYNGKYGTLIYQESNNTSSPCQLGSSMYCFQAIVEGQIN